MAEHIDSKLWQLEKDFWLGGTEVYRQHLADEALMIFRGMVLTKSQTVESIAAATRWKSVEFSEQRLVRLTHDAVALIYRASGSREGDRGPYSALVSSLYVGREEEWRLALHQQSPDTTPA